MKNNCCHSGKCVAPSHKDKQKIIDRINRSIEEMFGDMLDDSEPEMKIEKIKECLFEDDCCHNDKCVQNLNVC